MSIECGRKCVVYNCNELAIAKELCEKHYKRYQRHGDPEYNSRPKVPGYARNQDHPLYDSWRDITRMDLGAKVCERWKDFLKFVEDVGERPIKHQLRRKDASLIWSLENVYWQAPIERTEEKKIRAREYARLVRKADPNYVKANGLKKMYGLTLEKFNQMLADQGGVCKICGKPETKKKHGLSVDHCHTSHKVRGLLCSNCNTILGHAGDSPEILIKCAEYLTLLTNLS